MFRNYFRGPRTFGCRVNLFKLAVYTGILLDLPSSKISSQVKAIILKDTVKNTLTPYVLPLLLYRFIQALRTIKYPPNIYTLCIVGLKTSELFRALAKVSAFVKQALLIKIPSHDVVKIGLRYNNEKHNKNRNSIFNLKKKNFDTTYFAENFSFSSYI